MGKQKRHGTWKGKKNKPTPEDDRTATNYSTEAFVLENKAFDAYYKVIYFS